MKTGIVIASNDTEICWNALRYGNFALGKGDEMKVFFMGKGVEHQKVSTEKFNTVDQAEKIMQAGGKIYACGSCVKSREQEASEMCPISTMKDMYDIVKESDKVVMF